MQDRRRNTLILLIVILLALPDGLLNAERNWRARWKERRSA